MSPSVSGAAGAASSASITAMVPHFGHFAFFPALSAENFITCGQDLQRTEIASIETHSSGEMLLALENNGVATRCIVFADSRSAMQMPGKPQDKRSVSWGCCRAT